MNRQILTKRAEAALLYAKSNRQWFKVSKINKKGEYIIDLNRNGIKHFGWDKTPYGYNEMSSLSIVLDPFTGVFDVDGDFDYFGGYAGIIKHFTPKWNG